MHIKKNIRAGVDIGSQFIGIAYLDRDHRLCAFDYGPHNNDPLGFLENRLDNKATLIAVTGTDENFIEDSINIKPVNLIKCLVRQLGNDFGNIRNLIDIGANTGTFIRLNNQGQYKSSLQNSQCSAGTGSFLDEQMKRLELKYNDLPGLEIIPTPPNIATRCSVFARSDLIHCQQEGHSIESMWSGVCRGMLLTSINNLLKGRELQEGAVLSGGIGLNPHIRYFVGHQYKGNITIAENPHLVAAMGAVRIAESTGGFFERSRLKENSTNRPYVIHRQKTLDLKKSGYPCFDTHNEYLDEDNTSVRIFRPLETGILPVVLGFDIGSTSTKAVVMDRGNNIIMDVYRKTSARPIDAAQKVLSSIKKASDKYKTRYQITAFSTTGSGRNIIGKVFGADLIVNEISAHARGAFQADPSIDTIFEIGGQDAKYTYIQNGNVADSNMNYICAAGTGSFIEEQCTRLGIPVKDVGDEVMGITPPVTSDRCTVFMEQDIQHLLGKGHTKKEVLAAVMYSIAKNYLYKVVGNRRKNRHKIFFQGATARNKGLVAAFENLLDLEIVVSPFCHVMGAYGAALLAAEQKGAEDRKSKFKGFETISSHIDIKEEECRLCSNFCRITKAAIGNNGETASWGYMCGRDEHEKKKKRLDSLRYLEMRETIFNDYITPPKKGLPTIGMPMSLQTHSLFPFWSAFFRHLGCNIKLSRKTDSRLTSVSNQLAGAEFCFPGKIAVGHIEALLSDPSVDMVFVPALLEYFRNEETVRNWFCPIATAQPYYSGAALRNHDKRKKILSCTLNFNWSRRVIVNEIRKAFDGTLNLSGKQIRRSWDKALSAQQNYINRCQITGRQILKDIEETHEQSLLLIGRPYNIHDEGVNLRLPRIIGQYGFPIIPMEFIPFNSETRQELLEGYRNMFWNYGQVILNAVEFVRKAPDIFPVYLTNFNCGPDSYITGFAEQSMNGKPMLILELDEHNSAGGYITRIEAFLDVIRDRKISREKYLHDMNIMTLSGIDKATKLYIPLGNSNQRSSTMHLSRIFALMFERIGYECVPLPGSTRSNYELARQYSRGSECCPAIAVLGSILEHVTNSPEREFNIAMMTGHGPCRFGQYVHFYHSVLKQFGAKVNYINVKRGVALNDSVSRKFKIDVYKGIVAVDVLKKFLHRFRPYELEPGSVDQVFKHYEDRLYEAIRKDDPMEPVIAEASEAFKRTRVDMSRKKKLVGIIGEIFVRQEEFINEGLIDEIERNGGEAWLMPLAGWFLEGACRDLIDTVNTAVTDIPGLVKRGLSLYTLDRIEKRMMKAAGPELQDRHEPTVREIFDSGSKYLSKNLPLEDLPNIGRARIFAGKDRVDLIVNAKPFSCMPGNIVEAVLKQIEDEYDVPVINLSYEGGEGTNRPVRTILENL